MSVRERRLLLLRLAAVVVVVGVLFVLWRYTAAEEYAKPGRLASLAGALRHAWWAPVVAAGAFVVGGLLIFPVTVLILATAAAFGPWWGSAYSLAGSLASSLVLYCVGRWAGLEPIVALVGGRPEDLSRRIARQGILAVATVRIVPVAPFSLVNLMAGAAHVSLRDYVLGTIVGMGPGIVLMSFFADRVAHAVQHPTVGSLVAAVSLAAAIACAAWLLQRSLGADEVRRNGRIGEEGADPDG